MFQGGDNQRRCLKGEMNQRKKKLMERHQVRRGVLSFGWGPSPFVYLSP